AARVGARVRRTTVSRARARTGTRARARARAGRHEANQVQRSTACFTRIECGAQADPRRRSAAGAWGNGEAIPPTTMTKAALAQVAYSIDSSEGRFSAHGLPFPAPLGAADVLSVLRRAGLSAWRHGPRRGYRADRP